MSPRSHRHDSGPGRAANGAATDLEARAIELARADDLDAVHFLYALYVDEVYLRLRRLLEDSHKAELAAQDVFERLSELLTGYDPMQGPFVDWLFHVSRRAAKDPSTS